ncbi:MAG: flavodoxin family protein [Bacillota bacterium]|nr:flavodoxin family protein [Bacillota bacterium]
MKGLIIITSVCHGNTEKVARAMAEAINADVIESANVNLETLDNYDIIGFGSGIIHGKHHNSIFSLIEKINTGKGKKAFVFSTGGQGKAASNEAAKDALVQKGFEVIGSFACKGYDTYGPFKLIGGIAKGKPDDNDLANAKEFAKSLE